MAFFPELGLGIAFTMISLAPMVPDWVKGNDEPKTRVNVMAGLPFIGTDDSGDREQIYKDLSFGGCAPAISLFNANGDRVAYSRNDDCKNKIDQNEPKDIWAEYIKGGSTEKSEYITISASGTNAICISAVVVTYPSSDDTYAFLPGEVAKVCGDHDPDKHYYWSESSATVQFKGPTGKVQDGRPKCLWIDRPDDDGDKATKFQGFQVHLPDFKLDNTTFKTWEEDPGQMCDSLSRFGAYDVLNEMMCPQIFSPAPDYGARLPMPEVSGCFPSSIPDDNGDLYIDPCYDPRLSYKDRFNIANMYHHFCKEDWFDMCMQGGDCPDSRRRSLPNEDRYHSADNPIQKRFEGMLVKSRDIGQSASRMCNDKHSIGPDFYSEHEKSFCNMRERIVYPVCETQDPAHVECFDNVLNETRHDSGSRRRAPTTYLHIEDWW